VGPVDFAHAARAQRADDFVRTDARARLQCHECLDYTVRFSVVRVFEVRCQAWYAPAKLERSSEANRCVLSITKPR
jgi:hypothetical protein